MGEESIITHPQERVQALKAKMKMRRMEVIHLVLCSAPDFRLPQPGQLWICSKVFWSHCQKGKKEVSTEGRPWVLSGTHQQIQRVSISTLNRGMDFKRPPKNILCQPWNTPPVLRAICHVPLWTSALIALLLMSLKNLNVKIHLHFKLYLWLLALVSTTVNWWISQRQLRNIILH